MTTSEKDLMEDPSALPDEVAAERKGADGAPPPDEIHYPLTPSLLIEDIETLRVFADPLRLRILRALYENGEGRALSAKEIRARLHEEGNNRLYYHVRLLEEAGLIRKVAERKRRNLIEAFYTPVAKRLHIAPELFLRRQAPDDSGEVSALVHMASAYLGALRADLDLVRRAEPTEVLLAHREFTLSDEQAAQMRAELQAVLDKYEAMRPSRTTRPHRLTILAYPSGDADPAGAPRDDAS